MTVSTEKTKSVYQADGMNRWWDVNFPLMSEKDLQIFLLSPEGEEREITEGFYYDKAENKLEYPAQSTGLPALKEGVKIILLRRTPLTQDIRFTPQGKLDSAVLEAGYDKLTMLLQEVNEKVKRSIKYPVTEESEELYPDHFFKDINTAKAHALEAVRQAEEAASLSADLALQAQQRAQIACEEISSSASQAKTELETLRDSSKSELDNFSSRCEQAAQTAESYASSMIGKALGEVYWSQSASAADNVGALGLWKGERISGAATIYPDFFDWLLQHPQLCISEEAYETRLAQYGECPFYVLDEVGGNIRLPKLVHFVKNADDTNGIYQSQGEKVGVENNQTPAVYIYSQPSYSTLYPWVFAYNMAVAPSTAQAGEFTQALVSKADADLQNIPSSYDFVIESGTDENGNWYRKYKSGWLEQGGYSVGITSATVTFPRAFATSSPTVNITNRSGVAYVKAISATQFTWQDIEHAESVGVFWMAYGQAGV